MAPDTPGIPIGNLDNHLLVEDLCIALRQVGIRDHSLPDEPRAIAFINEVKVLYQEAQARGINLEERINVLNEETKWQMDVLLKECLDFPKSTPLVRNLAGRRRALLCTFCFEEERPIDDTRFYFCTNCLGKVDHTISSRTPIDGVFLFRTYNREHWCKHGNAETVFAEIQMDDLLSGTGFCKECIAEEMERRKGADL